ncbi:hypothetical protein Hanom_Chr09g00802481 [Helianthus anomalus]
MEKINGAGYGLMKANSQLLKGTGTFIDFCGTLGFHPKCFFGWKFEQENSFDNGVD